VLQPFGFRIGLFRPTEETRFPISLEELTTTDAIRGGPVRVSYANLVIESEPVYQVRLWIGRDASAEERVAILAVLRSIGFLRGPQ